MRLQCPACQKPFEVPSASPHAKIACPWCKTVSSLSELLPPSSQTPSLRVETRTSASPLTTNEWTAYPHPVPIDDSLLPKAHIPPTPSPIPDLPPIESAIRARLQKTGDHELFDPSLLHSIPEIPEPAFELHEAPPLPPRPRSIPSQESLPSISPSSPAIPAASRSTGSNESLHSPRSNGRAEPPRPSRPPAKENVRPSSGANDPFRSAPTTGNADAYRSSPTTGGSDILRSSRTAAGQAAPARPPSAPSSASLPSRHPTSASHAAISRKTSASSATLPSDRRSSSRLSAQDPASKHSTSWDQLVEDFVSNDKTDDAIEIRYQIRHAGKETIHGPFREEEILAMLEQRQIDPFDQIAKMKISSKGTRTEAWILLKDSMDFKAIAGVFEQKPVHIDSIFATSDEGPSRPELPTHPSPIPSFKAPASGTHASSRNPLFRYLPFAGLLLFVVLGAIFFFWWKKSDETRRLSLRSQEIQDEQALHTILREGNLAKYRRLATSARSSFEQNLLPHEWAKIRFFWYAVDEFQAEAYAPLEAKKITQALATRLPSHPLLSKIRLAEAIAENNQPFLRQMLQNGEIRALPSAHPEWGHLKGRAFELLGRDDDGEVAYRTLLTASPEFQRSRYRLFWLLLRQKKPLLAQQTLQRLALLDPPYIPALLESLERSHTSPWLLKQAILIRDFLASRINEQMPSPLRARWHFLYASHLWGTDNKLQAWHEMERALFLHPQEARYRKQRIFWLLQQKETDKASITLEEEIKNFPADPDFLLFLFDLLKQQKRLPALQTRLQELKEISAPSPAQAYARLVLEADLLSQDGKPSEAMALYKRALEIRVRTAQPDARLPYANLLLQASRPDEALALATSLARDFPSSPDVALLQSQIVAQKGDLPQALLLIQPFKASLALDTPHRCAITRHLAYLAFLRDQCAELSSLPLEVCKTQNTLLQQAFCFLRASQREKAAPLLNALSNDLSNPPALRLLLASLESLQEDKDKAIEIYKDLLSHENTLPLVLSELVSLFLQTKQISQASALLKSFKKKKSLKTRFLTLETLRLEALRTKAAALRRLRSLQKELTDPEERAASLRTHAQILLPEERKEALALLTRALLLRPNDLFLLVERASLLADLQQKAPCTQALQIFFSKAPLDHPYQIRANLLRSICSP